MSRLSGRRAEFTWDPGNINNNAHEDVDFTFVGAKLGDFVFVTSTEDTQHLNLYAHVESDDTVNVHLTNNTGGAVNLGVITIRIKLIPWGDM